MFQFRILQSPLLPLPCPPQPLMRDSPCGSSFPLPGTAGSHSCHSPGSAVGKREGGAGLKTGSTRDREALGSARVPFARQATRCVPQDCPTSCRHREPREFPACRKGPQLLTLPNAQGPRACPERQSREASHLVLERQEFLVVGDLVGKGAGDIHLLWGTKTAAHPLQASSKPRGLPGPAGPLQDSSTTAWESPSLPSAPKPSLHTHQFGVFIEEHIAQMSQARGGWRRGEL